MLGLSRTELLQVLLCTLLDNGVLVIVIDIRFDLQILIRYASKTYL